MASTYDGNFNSIRSILGQVRLTTIKAGHLDGHVLTSSQLDVIIDNLDQLEGLSPRCATPDFDDDDAFAALRAEKKVLDDQIAKKQFELITAPRERRSQLNEEIGRIQSRLAQVKKAIKKYGQCGATHS
jgi:uncharacterized protein YicC (UPF0701 family)